MRGNKNPVDVIKRILHKTNRILNECDFCSGSSGLTLKSFQYNDLVDPCVPFAAETFESTLYHNGANDLPVLGDTIYLDAEGTEVAALTNGVIENGLEPYGFDTDSEGVSVVFTCR